MERSIFTGRHLTRPDEILVVDDESTTRDILSAWIGAEGFQVSTASDAEHALEILAERQIAVVSVDKDMPGHGGIWLVAEIQKRYPTVAMLLATGDDSIAPSVSLSRGVFGYLVKPLLPEAFIAAIKAGVRWHRSASHQAPPEQPRKR